MISTDKTLSLELAIGLLQHVPAGIVISDNNDMITWCNNTLALYVNEKAEVLINTPLSALKSSKLRPISEQSDTILLPGGQNMPDRWLKHQIITLDNAGAEHYSATFYTDITDLSTLLAEQEKLTEQLNQLSTVDQESGLLNHRAMLQNLEPLISRSRRYDNQLSLITMELMNLDPIIDEFGPEAATQAIVSVSRLLKDQMRWADIVSRVEYNRFVFVLPETDKSAALHLANKISTQINELPVKLSENEILHLDANFGISAWEKGNDVVLLLRRATQALEAAKNKGANAIEAG